MIDQVLAALRGHGVTGDPIRTVNHDIRPGVEVDMGVVYKDLDETPEAVARTPAAHLARHLVAEPYPGVTA
jgi:hypothetical protein